MALPNGAVALTDPKQIPDFNVLGQVGASGTPGSYLYGTPKVPESFTTDQTKTNATFKDVPPATTPDPSAFVSSLKGSQEAAKQAYDAELAKANAITQPAEAERSALAGRLGTALAAAGGKVAAQDAANEKYQIPQITKQINDITLSIAQKSGEFEKAYAGVEGQGRGITTGIVTGQQGAIRRQQAAEIGALTSIQQALQGNLTMAQNTANRSVDLQFADKQAEIDNLKTLLDVNKDSLSAADKKRAEALAVALQDRQNALDEAKQNKKDVLTLTQQAASNNADSATLQKMAAAGDAAAAIKIGSKFLGNTETSVVDANGRKMLINTKTGQLIKDLGSSNEDKFTVVKTGVDNNGNDVYSTFNTTNGQSTPINFSGTTNVGSGIVNGFNIGTYATDPNHEKAVANILANIGQFKTLNDVQTYINQNAPSSPITAQMISAASAKFGVPWEMLVAMMQQDSSLGTAGKGAKTFNPGNVGNTDSGATKNYGNWQAGVDAVGQWLSGHRATPENDSVASIKSSLQSINPRLTAEQKKSAQTAINSALAKGDYELAKQAVIATAISSLPAVEQGKAFGRAAAIDSLNNLSGLFQQYKDNGGNTGLLSGKVEDIAQKVGETSNPTLANLGVQIQTAIIAYRNAVSGAAFTESEAAQYNKLFPSTGKTKELNDALISGLLSSFNLNQKSALKTVMGEKNYDGLFKNFHADVSGASGATANAADDAYIKSLKLQ